ncbi:envelope stress response membrane protein PspC [Motilimonas sp. 1_MG-2023]|uniref:envelope stress response membrane protein PspC n=1 Tax=Motilimonas TaxID=1914248 RepID=UPI0026E2CBDD|nr:envelope stress response membrane protein PspC [Motilimonas sp. 1_MG-2023]MDO6526278.1 envelope stress response membrane protein PspC [Motilimonas sp. 1_MG-2023]
MNQSSKHLYRDPKAGKVAGVCIGLADYFNMEVWLVRIIVISIFLFNFPLAALGYGAAWLMLDKKPDGSMAQPEHNESSYQKSHIHVKSKVWQSGELPKQALAEMSQVFDKLESKIGQMEKVVTSDSFKVDREINRL